MSITVKMLHCGGNYPNISYTPRRSTVERIAREARTNVHWSVYVDALIEKHFGKNCGLLLDHGLRDQGIYGQIFESLPASLGGGSASKTGRVRFEFYVKGKRIDELEVK